MKVLSRPQSSLIRKLRRRGELWEGEERRGRRLADQCVQKLANQSKCRLSSFVLPFILRAFQFSHKRRLGTSQMKVHTISIKEYLLMTTLHNTDLTRFPLLNACLVVNGTDTSVSPMSPGDGVGGTGGSEANNIYRY